MVVDYSKWDHFGSDEEEEESESTDDIINCQVDDNALVRCEPAAQRTARRPRVTRLDKPSSVNFGGQPAQQPSPPAAVKMREPNLGCVTDAYGWEQTAHSIDVYLKVPSKNETGKAMPALKLKAGMPPVDATDCSYPASLGARSYKDDEGDGSAFPSAHGILIEWKMEKEPSSFSRLWTWNSAKSALCFDENFPLPISDDEETWLWVLTEECPFFDGRSLHFHASKKRSAALAGVTLWWDRIFSKEAKLDLKEKIQAQSSPTARAFSAAWEEAHRLFREQIKQRQPTPLDGKDEDQKEDADS